MKFYNLINNHYLNDYYLILVAYIGYCIILVLLICNCFFKQIKKKVNNKYISMMYIINIFYFFHLLSIIYRFLNSQTPPWSNMYEFCLTLSFVLFTFFLICLKKQLHINKNETIYILLTIVIILTFAIFYLSAPSIPLMPALQDNMLILHVSLVICATAFLTIGFIFSIIYLYRIFHHKTFIKYIEKTQSLEYKAYKINICGFILWTLAAIAGAYWAEKAWGRYWGWDNKEIWTFATWVFYACYIHSINFLNYKKQYKAYYFVILGYISLLFSFTIVNILLPGLHSYSGV